MKTISLVLLAFTSLTCFAQVSCLKINEVLVEKVSEVTTPCMKKAPRFEPSVYSGSWSFKVKTTGKYVREYFNRCSGSVMKIETITKKVLLDGASYPAEDRSLKVAQELMVEAERLCKEHRKESQAELDLLYH